MSKCWYRRFACHAFICAAAVAILRPTKAASQSVPASVAVVISSEGFPMDYSSFPNLLPTPPELAPPELVKTPEAYLPHCRIPIISSLWPWTAQLLLPKADLLLGTAVYQKLRQPRRLGDVGLSAFTLCTLSIIASAPVNVLDAVCKCMDTLRLATHHRAQLFHKSECRLTNFLLTGGGCNAGADCSAPLVDGIPSYGDLSLPLENPLLTLPELPDFVGDLKDVEGPTYHMLWRAVLHMYDSYIVRYCEGGEEFFPLLPEWDTVLSLDSLPEGAPEVNARPLCHAAIRGASLLTACRGSQDVYDWLTNVQFSMVGGMVGGLEWPGHVHEGMVKYVTALLPRLSALLQANAGISRIVLTGHSLGAAIVTLLAYQLTELMPEKTVHAVVFAGPRVGDATFMRALARTVNYRNVVFELDIVAAAPCKRMPKCSVKQAIVETAGPPQGYWMFADTPGKVQIRLTDLPEDSLWRTSGSPHTEVDANHSCVYTCWLSRSFAPLDTLNRCYRATSASAPPSPNVCR